MFLYLKKLNFLSKKLIYKISILLVITISINYYLENAIVRKPTKYLNPSLTLKSSVISKSFTDSSIKKKLVLIKNDFQELNKTNLKNILKTKKVVKQDDYIPNIRLFNLSRSLTPLNIYESIQCRESVNVFIQTTLCVHNLNNDIHVSGSIWRDGVWELHILWPFIEYVNLNPDWLVIDIGAQIGQYSLFSAKMGRQVLCVEPFYDNILRIHKAATQENIQNNIVLITNAISDKRNEIKMLHQEDDNIGGQSLLNYKDKKFFKDNNTSSNKYLVETILFDDIIPYLPKTKDNKDFKKAIMKIDIEGFEPYAFQHANKLFTKLDIKVIFMEWGNLPKQIDNYDLILKMIDFFFSKKFTPYNNNIELSKHEWQYWPWDIIWIKNDT